MSTRLTRIDLLIGLGTAQRQAGIASFRETLLEAARQAQELGDTDRLVAAALANSRGWFSALGQLDAEKVEVIEAALDALPDTDSPERARLLATLCSELNFHSPLERRLALADEAKAIARRLGDRATFVDVVTRCGAALIAPSTLATELADFAEAFATASDLDDPVALLSGCTSVAALAVRAGQFELARERLAMLRAMAEKLGQPVFLWLASLLPTPRSPCCTATPKRQSSSPLRPSRWARQADSPTPLPSTACSSWHSTRTGPVGGAGVAHRRRC